MNTPRHTPGPWGIEWTDQRAWIGPMRKNDGKVERIVCSTEREGLIPESLAEKDANARLIAAAPEFYEAAKMLEDLMNNWPDDFKMEAREIAATLQAGSMIEKFRTAIAKVELAER